MLILITMFLLTMLMLIQIGWMLTPSPHLSLSNSFHISQQIISMSQNKHFYQCDVQCLKCSSKYAINIVGNELVFSDCLLVPQTSENSRYKTMLQSSSSSSILSMIIIIIIVIIILLIITVSLCERSTEQREIVPPSNKVLLERILLLHLLLLLLHLLLLLFPLFLLWKLPHPRLSHPRATKCVP